MKERLLGAAVLIVAAVLLIPIFLDGPRPPDTVSRELALPVPDAGNSTASGAEVNRTHTVEIDNSPRSREFQAAAAAVAPPAAVPPEREPATTASDPVTTRAPATKAVASPPPAVNKPPPSVNGWAVQVGSFSSESNARRLMEHLKGDGYPAFIVRNVVSGRVMFRVRVGPESDRPRAEALAERLRTDRQQTQLVRHP